MIWLRAFRFGPVEYVWRAVTYRCWPRMLKEPATPKQFV
ncbi:DUF418 domain-containing protein [Roseivirga sp. BDSF3-8]